MQTKMHTCLWSVDGPGHGLRTPNEGINQRYLKNWADVADKICFGRTKKIGIGIEVKAISSLGVRSPWFDWLKSAALLTKCR